MRQVVDRYRRSPFMRNVATVVSGSAVAQALTMAAMPVLSRLYDPAAPVAVYDLSQICLRGVAKKYLHLSALTNCFSKGGLTNE